MELSDDLIYIEAEDISPAKITKHVQERFSKDQIYTRIGEKVLLVLNPFKTLPSSSDDVMKSIKSAVKCGEERQAHIYEMAANAYFQTIRSKKDHAILF
jgi:myosin heavy subunit